MSRNPILQFLWTRQEVRHTFFCTIELKMHIKLEKSSSVKIHLRATTRFVNKYKQWSALMTRFIHLSWHINAKVISNDEISNFCYHAVSENEMEYKIHSYCYNNLCKLEPLMQINIGMQSFCFVCFIQYLQQNSRSFIATDLVVLITTQICLDWWTWV